MKVNKKYIKNHFEANVLDGDDVKDCGGAMISAEAVLDYIYILVRDIKKLERSNGNS